MHQLKLSPHYLNISSTFSENVNTVVNDDNWDASGVMGQANNEVSKIMLPCIIFLKSHPLRHICYKITI